MMLHQDGSRHEWVPGKLWDLIVTMDDASNKHYSMFFVEEEGAQSSFQGINDVIKNHGCLPLCIQIVAVITGIPLKLEEKWTRVI
jgi:hypothetical protein